jgi:DNA-binding MarR family transcriptional regulator
MINTEDVHKLKKFGDALKAVRMATDPTIPSQVVQAFIAVALNEGKSLTEIAEAMGARISTASRQLLDLGDRNRRMEPGYHLIDRRQDPMNLRVNIYTLTPKGRMLAQAIIEGME